MNKIVIDLISGEQSVIQMSPEEVTIQESISDTPNKQIDAQIVALEQANPITHRTMREFIIGVSTGIAAAQGVTPAQLMNPADPHYSHAFAAFVGVNAQTVALRAQKTP